MDIYLNIINLVAASVLAFFIVRSSRSLEGSFFKQYYRLLLIGVLALVAGFVLDIVYSDFLISMIIVKALRHIMFVTFGFVFVYAANILPKEAAEYMKDTDLNKRSPIEPKRL